MKNNTESTFRLGGMVISDRIAADLLTELRSGKLAQNDRLPAEIELAEALGVSRTVIRDALSELEREGYIERVRGIGTVVNRKALALKNRIDQKLEYFPLIRSHGSYPHTDSLQVSVVPADDMLADSLNLTPGDLLVCVKKRVLADDKPVIYSIDYIPKSLFRYSDYTRLDFTAPIFDILERECNQQPSSNLAHIRACCGDEVVRNALRIAPGEAVLLLEEVCCNRMCQPIMHSLSYYTDYFDFTILRKML